MAATPAQGDFRVLWLGDPRVLPGQGWEVAPGLAYTVSEDGLPDITGLWPGSSPGQAAALGGRRTGGPSPRHSAPGSALGALCRAVHRGGGHARPRRSPGLQTPIAHPPPADLSARWLRRSTCARSSRRVGSTSSSTRWRCPCAPRGPPWPGRRRRAGSAVTGAAPELTGWRPALLGRPDATAVTGRVPAGTVLDARGSGHELAPDRTARCRRARLELLRVRGDVPRGSTGHGDRGVRGVVVPRGRDRRGDGGLGRPGRGAGGAGLVARLVVGTLGPGRVAAPPAAPVHGDRRWA